MRAIALAFALISFAAQAQEVARVFGVAVTAAELGQPPSAAARQLKERALREAMPRYVTAHGLQATPAEIAAYQAWEAEARRVVRQQRAERLAQIEQELKRPGLDERRRKALAEERDVYAAAARSEPEIDKIDPQTAARTQSWWIEGYKFRKALYEKYGGRVGISKWGPDPAGATEALLREHERLGELQILDAALAKEFWQVLAREPRMPASQPEHYDFTYYWLKPPQR